MSDPADQPVAVYRSQPLYLRHGKGGGVILNNFSFLVHCQRMQQSQHELGCAR